MFIYPVWRFYCVGGGCLCFVCLGEKFETLIIFSREDSNTVRHCYYSRLISHLEVRWIGLMMII